MLLQEDCLFGLEGGDAVCELRACFCFGGRVIIFIYMVMYGGGAGWKYEQAETRSLLTGLRSSASCRLARYSDRQSTGMATDRMSSFDSFFFSFRVLDFWMVVVLWLWREGEKWWDECPRSQTDKGNHFGGAMERAGDAVWGMLCPA